MFGHYISISFESWFIRKYFGFIIFHIYLSIYWSKKLENVCQLFQISNLDSDLRSHDDTAPLNVCKVAETSDATTIQVN